MTTTYGMKRVLEPQYVLPTSAWKLDNARDIYPKEYTLRVRVSSRFAQKPTIMRKKSDKKS